MNKLRGYQRCVRNCSANCTVIMHFGWLCGIKSIPVLSTCTFYALWECTWWSVNLPCRHTALYCGRKKSIAKVQDSTDVIAQWESTMWWLKLLMEMRNWMTVHELTLLIFWNILNELKVFAFQFDEIVFFVLEIFT